MTAVSSAWRLLKVRYTNTQVSAHAGFTSKPRTESFLRTSPAPSPNRERRRLYRAPGFSIPRCPLTLAFFVFLGLGHLVPRNDCFYPCFFSLKKKERKKYGTLLSRWRVFIWRLFVSVCLSMIYLTIMKIPVPSYIQPLVFHVAVNSRRQDNAPQAGVMAHLSHMEHILDR